MHFVIMGSGRVGAQVAATLDHNGHSVAIIDRDSEAFRKLPAKFGGKKVTGLGFDRDTLLRANIQEAYAFVAVSNGDNSNILAARTAREIFGVQHVVARIYDPQRADVYSRLGVPTTSPVRWTSSEILRQILPGQASVDYEDTQFGVKLVRVQPNVDWVGVSIQSVQRRLDVKVAYVGRSGKPIFNLGEIVIQENDQLFLVMPGERVDEIRRALARKPSDYVKEEV